VRKIDVLQALVAQGAMGGEPEREKFRELCRLLGAIYHYEYFDQLERLRTTISISIRNSTAIRASTQLLSKIPIRTSSAALTSVLHGANFIEVPHDEIERSHREHAIVRVNIETPMDDYARSDSSAAAIEKKNGWSPSVRPAQARRRDRHLR